MVYITEKKVYLKSKRRYATYLYLHKSYRDKSGKVRTKHIAYLGKASQYNQKELKDMLNKYRNRGVAKDEIKRVRKSNKEIKH